MSGGRCNILDQKVKDSSSGKNLEICLESGKNLEICLQIESDISGERCNVLDQKVEEFL